MHKNSYFLILVFTVLCISFQNCSPFAARSPQSQIGSEFKNLDASPGIQFKQRKGTITSPKRKLRLLNGPEYTNTIKNLTGYSPESAPFFADRSGGFQNGAGLKLDSNILNLYGSLADDATKFYLENGIKADHNCFGNNLTENCTKEIIESFAEKAFRQPLASSRVNELFSLFSEVDDLIDDSKSSLQLTLKKVLLSYETLYKSEMGILEGGDYRLTQYEIASLVSYSLTGDLPDRDLLEAAEKNQLKGALLKSQVQRVLGTDKSKKWVGQFFRDWLKLDELTLSIESPEDYPKWTSQSIPSALNKEFDLFIENVVFNKSGTSSDLLLNTDYFVNEETAPIYGLEASSKEFEQKSKIKGRAGVLTLASVLSSHASRTFKEKDQPVTRGILIKNQLLCENVGFPSGLSLSDAVKKIREQHPSYDDYTVRKQYEVTMNQGQDCAFCHSQFMPFGYLQSGFNAFGEIQAEQKGQRVIASASPQISGDKFNFKDIIEFMPVLAESENYQFCFSQKLATYILGDSSESTKGNYRWVVYEDHERLGGNITELITETLTNENLFKRK